MLEFDKYTKEIEQKLHKYCEKVALEIAKKTDINIYNSIYPDESSMGRMRDAIAISEPTSEGAKVIGSGQDMMFMEFGAGYGADHPLGADFGFVPGSWSKDHAQQFIKYGCWWYNGVKYTNIPANACMYNATEEVKGKLQDIADEVFG